MVGVDDTGCSRCKQLQEWWPPLPGIMREPHWYWETRRLMLLRLAAVLRRLLVAGR